MDIDILGYVDCSSQVIGLSGEAAIGTILREKSKNNGLVDLLSSAEVSAFFNVLLDEVECEIDEYKLTKADGSDLDEADLAILDGSNYENDGVVKFQTDLDPVETIEYTQTFYITAAATYPRGETTKTTPAITVTVGEYDVTSITASFNADFSNEYVTASNEEGELFSINIGSGSIDLGEALDIAIDVENAVSKTFELVTDFSGDTLRNSASLLRSDGIAITDETLNIDTNGVSL